MIKTIDYYILDRIQGLHCNFLDFLMPKITALGNKGIVWILMSFGLCISKKYRETGFNVLLGLVIGVLICNVLLKPLVARQRPYRSDMTLLVVDPPDYSFPSGHTMSSFIAAFIITCSGSHLCYAAVPLAVLIAFSRLYLYVHFPSDVLAAVAIAAAIVFFMSFLPQI